jgi:hypothetical protein
MSAPEAGGTARLWPGRCSTSLRASPLSWSRSSAGPATSTRFEGRSPPRLSPEPMIGTTRSSMSRKRSPRTAHQKCRRVSRNRSVAGDVPSSSTRAPTCGDSVSAMRRSPTTVSSPSVPPRPGSPTPRWSATSGCAGVRRRCAAQATGGPGAAPEGRGLLLQGDLPDHRLDLHQRSGVRLGPDGRPGG